MKKLIATRDVCLEVGLTEPALRHVLRRPDAPRPDFHPTARVFLWTRADIARLRAFLEGSNLDRPEGAAAPGRSGQEASHAR